MIEVNGLVKRYGRTTAVAGLSFAVRPGQVTGFLGPNGSGKSTTMRVIAGLDRPDAGRATVAGRLYRDLADPLRAVGVMLDARAVHRGRSARNHLRALARTHGIADRRVTEVLEIAGLTAAADRRAGGFSLGMSQRLGIAAAILGDPAAVVLDEPVNGLDPDGVLWVRTLVQRLAAEDRTVLVSSHLMTETAVTADHLVIVEGGRLVADTTVEDLIARAGVARVVARTPGAAALAAALERSGATVTLTDPATLHVEGAPSTEVGAVAAAIGVVLHELVPQRASLEQAYMRLIESVRPEEDR